MSIWQMIRNIKEIFPPKTGMRKATSCKIQGMSKQSIHCVQNTLHSIARMSRQSIQASNYIVYHNSNYSNKEIHRIIASNYSLFRIKT